MDALYIHIPFCNKKCNYCDFWTFINMDHEFDFYTKNIIEEINKGLIPAFIKGFEKNNFTYIEVLIMIAISELKKENLNLC